MGLVSSFKEDDKFEADPSLAIKRCNAHVERESERAAVKAARVKAEYMHAHIHMKNVYTHTYRYTHTYMLMQGAWATVYVARVIPTNGSITEGLDQSQMVALKVTHALTLWTHSHGCLNSLNFTELKCCRS